LMMEAISFSETSVLTRVTRRHNPEEGILHSHRCENLKSYQLNRFYLKMETECSLRNIVCFKRRQNGG
jgi:hypothetical protein